MTPTNEPRPTTITTPSDREIVVTRVFDAPRRLVWEAFTSPEHLPRWMAPAGWSMPVCEMELRVGGTRRVTWRGPEGMEMTHTGEFREVSPPERLVSTESWGEGWPETINTVVLTEERGRTTLWQQVLYPSKEARDAALKSGMTEGMQESFRRLDEALAAMA